MSTVSIATGDVCAHSHGSTYPLTVVAFGDDTFQAVNLHTGTELGPRRSTYERAAVDLVPLEFEATHLRGNRYAVRPVGALGTCGFHPRPWTVRYVTARNPREALLRASAVQS